MSLDGWFKKWNVPYQAQQELRAVMGVIPAPEVTGGTGSEARVQSEVRLAAASAGFPLWRNNVGAMKDERGNFFRFGLANDSSRMNESLKSGDLIGVKPRFINPADLGKTIGQFVSYEVKAPGWRYTGTKREQAQLKWIELITSLGGDARFITKKEDL